MALIAGIGVGLFVLLLFAGLLLLTCVLASAHKFGPAIIGGATLIYVIVAIVLILSPRVSDFTTESETLKTDARLLNTSILMTILGLTVVCAVVGMCTNQLTRSIQAKPL